MISSIVPKLMAKPSSVVGVCSGHSPASLYRCYDAPLVPVYLCASEPITVLQTCGQLRASALLLCMRLDEQQGQLYQTGMYKKLILLHFHWDFPPDRARKRWLALVLKRALRCAYIAIRGVTEIP